MSNLCGDRVDEIEGVRVGEILLRQNGLLFDINENLKTKRQKIK